MVDCYHGDGDDYRGEATRTEKGTRCIAWSDAGGLSVNVDSHPDAVSSARMRTEDLRLMSHCFFVYFSFFTACNAAKKKNAIK